MHFSLAKNKRSDFQVHVIEIDGKRHVVSRIPGPSDFWADATPEVRFKSAIIIVIICIFGLIMDTFHLQWGGIASEAQLSKGNLATEIEMTGPSRNYWYDAWLFTREEVAKRDPRVKPMDVKMETHPERRVKFYGSGHKLGNQYIGNGRFHYCVYYLIQDRGQTEFVYGTVILRLDQRKQLGLFVQQKWIVDDFKITYSEIRKI